jgi:aromatic ring-opening dioxygenase catalytic subunit (LigB family)
MTEIDHAALDRYITGNWGEDMVNHDWERFCEEVLDKLTDSQFASFEALTEGEQDRYLELRFEHDHGHNMAMMLATGRGPAGWVK